MASTKAKDTEAGVNLGEVAVVITACNRPEYLQRSLESVSVQGDNLEVVVVDDSDRRWQPRIADIVSAYSGYGYVRCGERAGASASRNTGVRSTRRWFVAFLDDDDYWLRGYLQKAYELATARSLDLVLTPFFALKGDVLVPEKHPPPVLNAEDCLIRNPGLRGSNLFISRRVFWAVGGFDETLRSMNDMDFAFRLALYPHLRYGCRVEPLVVYREHMGSRLSTPLSDDKVQGVRRFWEKYQNAMSPKTRCKFRRKVHRLWGVAL